MVYNYLEAGKRIREKRILLGLSQDEIAEKIDRSAKFFADIERGSCGMSIETLLAIGKILDMPLDYIIYGQIYGNDSRQTDEVTAILSILNRSPKKERERGVKILKLFLEREIEETEE